MNSIYETIDEEIENQSEDEKRLAYISKYRREFVLCPAFFKTMDELPELLWKSFRFNIDKHNIPKRQGVYVFSISLGHKNLPNNSYVLYIGKAGDLKSNNTLANRYYNYLREIRIKTRPDIHRMLNLWKDHLTYHYATVPNGLSTGLIEKQLTTIFIPPYNTNDFVAEVRDLLKGASIL